jgi:hypothetical protein
MTVAVSVVTTRVASAKLPAGVATVSMPPTTASAKTSARSVWPSPS